MRIPAGVEDGQRIRVKGRGAPGRANGPAGDLYVTVRVGNHPVFGRRGRNLTLTVPVTFPEAALGSTVKVPTLDEPVTLRVPAGTSSGRTFRVKGRGVPGHGRTSTGDLLVTVGRDRAHETDRRATRRGRGVRPRLDRRAALPIWR